MLRALRGVSLTIETGELVAIGSVGIGQIHADEPTGNLDTRTSVEIMAILQALNRTGITIVLVTHEEDIARYARRVLRFRDGALIEDEQVTTPIDPARRARGRCSRPGGAAMRVRGTAELALAALASSKARTALTMLDVIIGVAAVVTMMAVGGGARARVEAQIQSLGSNVIVVISGSITTGGVRLGTGSQLTLTEDDAKAMEREIESMQIAAPAVRGGVQVIAGNANWSTALFGVTPGFLDTRDWAVARGRPLAPDDVDAAAKVAILGLTVEAAARVLSLLLASIASVSLVVGGIMNIMLVSVTERTREIGLRRAVGARRRDLLGQFLIEAVAVSLTGGLIGIVVGAVASWAIARFAGWPAPIRAATVVPAFLFAGMVGIFFGFYPARKASLLNPIDALRHE